MVTAMTDNPPLLDIYDADARSTSNTLLLIASNVTVADAEGFRDSLEELWALRDAQAMLQEDAANGD